MQPPFKLYGAELSPYSIKVRAFLRYKGLAFEWLPRSLSRQEEFARYAKLPLIPVLVDANDAAMQDSTPIMESLDAQFPEPSATPADAGLAFLSALIEDYADEWLNKAMFHYRWSYDADAESAARRIVAMMFEGGEAPAGLEDSVRTRMVARLHHVGSSAETAPVIEAAFVSLLQVLEPIFAARPYLLGGRPCIGDFGLYGQLAELLSDPTPGALLRAEAPSVVKWIERMEHPTAQGDTLAFDDAVAALEPLLRRQVGAEYLAWAVANADAVADDAQNLRLEIGGREYAQKPQRYAAKALAEVRRKLSLVAGHEALTALLRQTGLLEALARADAGGPAAESGDGDDGEDEEALA